MFCFSKVDQFESLPESGKEVNPPEIMHDLAKEPVISPSMIRPSS